MRYEKRCFARINYMKYFICLNVLMRANDVNTIFLANRFLLLKTGFRIYWPL